MKLEKLDELYTRDAASFGHLRGLQAVFNAGIKEGEHAAHEQLKAKQNIGHEVSTSALIGQVADMGRIFRK